MQTQTWKSYYNQTCGTKKKIRFKLSDDSEKTKAKGVPYWNQKKSKFEKFVNVLFVFFPIFGPEVLEVYGCDTN